MPKKRGKKNHQDHSTIDEKINVDPKKEMQVDNELNDNISKEIVNMETSEIKSRAVVKYSVPRPPDFIKLQCNTDLNLPPANWLSSSTDSYGLQKAFTLTHKGFTSFRMAQMYPDCLGDVDVISDAENIKKLLKIPYTKDLISMFIHRVGNTLLIDNFDLYKNFTISQDGLFQWLHDFVSTQLSTKAIQDGKRLYTQDRSREALKNRSLESKFIYHSLGMDQSERMIKNEVIPPSSKRSVEYPVLPNPAPEVEAPESSSDNKYNRNVVWTFEDIEMLLGSDMPIFGGGNYPCISLRLRDMKQPINVLTGIDYWLDNLMSNVPEVVMCYHLNGIVQKYEFIKTEEFPKLKNSKFSPQVIKDVAQNILYFLKMNATKPGHTYWLFKDKEDEVIKLYDLTCLIPQNDKVQNPFIIPVAMLLYRVARNFMRSERKKTGVVKTLLEHCIKLLPVHKYPEIVTSSYFMLSEIYLPMTTDPKSPKFEIEDKDDDKFFYSDNEREKEEAFKTLDLDSDNKDQKNAFKPTPPIAGDVDYRCLKALTYVHNGLGCLHYFLDEPDESVPMGEGMTSARSSEPIPMGYKKLNVDKKETDEIPKVDPKVKKSDEGVSGESKNASEQSCTEKGAVKKASKSKKKKKQGQEKRIQDQELPSLLVMNNKETEHLPTWKQKNTRQDGISWKTHLKILLYEKAVLAFATLSEYYFGKEQYDNCFRNLRLLARCSLIMKNLRDSVQIEEVCLLGRAGDCCVRIYRKSFEEGSDLQKLRQNITTHTTAECDMLSQILSDEQLIDSDSPPNLMCVYDSDFQTREDIIKLAVLCYEEALKISHIDKMQKRLGNALNELGNHYLNAAEISIEGKDIRGWTKKAREPLLKSLKVFESLKDVENMALINSNLGHMHRLIEFSHHLGKPLTACQKENFAKANEYYKKALKILDRRDRAPIIWDSIKFELCASLVSEVSLTQDYPPENVDYEDYYQTVLKALSVASDSCDTNENHTKYNGFRIKMGVIKHRYAAIYHSRFLKSDNFAISMKSFHLAELNYKEAAQIFFETQQAFSYFRTILKRLKMTEHLFQKHHNTSQDCPYIYECISAILNSINMVQLILADTAALTDTHIPPSDEDATLTKILDSCIGKLQYYFKTSLKICTNEKLSAHLIKLHKDCYAVTLSYSLKKTDENMLTKFSETLCRIQLLMATVNA